MTKNQLIAQLKKDNPTIREGSDEQGYVELLAEEYEARINLWADNLLAKQAEATAKAEAEAKKLEAQAKLAAIGITAEDLKALGRIGEIIMTKNELIAQLKKDNLSIREGSDEQGYVNLSAEEYEARIKLWADNILAKQAEASAKAEAEAKKLEAQAKLAAIGITAEDLKALGL